MACLLTQGFSWDCKSDTNGVDAIYLVEFNTADTYTKASGEVTAHALDGGRVYFKWELEQETTSFEQKIMPSDENGSVAYEAEIKIRGYGMTTAKRNELKLMAKTRMRCIVKDNEGIYHACGLDTGVRMQETGGNFGKGYGDFKGWEITLKHRETDLPAIVQSGVVSSLSLS